MRVLRQVKATIDRHRLLVPNDTVVLGVSGGPDSLCMFHVLRQLAEEYDVKLHVAHLNHGIRGQEADDDADFVSELCESYDVPCTVERVDVPALASQWGMALEEAARQIRYVFLGSLVRSLGGKTVAVAHNADDQVETVLMHFLRGSGLAGLRGMRPLSWLEELRLVGEPDKTPPESTDRIRLVRPLLEVPREEIEAYCRDHDLRPRFDRSNLDQTYLRNRLRHELVPLLETYNPNVRSLVRRTSKVIAADYDLVRGLLNHTWPKVVRDESEEAIIFDLAVFRLLPLGLRRSFVREGIHRLRSSLRNINWVHVEDALQVIDTGRAGAMATLPQGLSLTVGYTEIVLASEGYEHSHEDWPRIRGPLTLPIPGGAYIPDGRWTVTTRIVRRQILPDDWPQNPDPYLAYLDAERAITPLILRPRQEGDYFVPLGLNHRQKLSDFMINAKIPRGERATVPLLISGSKITWVVGWRVDARFAVTSDTQMVLTVQFRRDQG